MTARDEEFALESVYASWLTRKWEGAVTEFKKACPKCGKNLTIRGNGETQEEFLGCSQYPECEHTEPLPTDIILRRQGAATLPGL